MQDEQHLYLLLQPALGGVLRTHLRLTEGQRFSEDVTRLYAAQAILALHYLHQRSIVHRNLHLGAMGLDLEGRLKLLSFGAARKVDTEAKKKQMRHLIFGVHPAIPLINALYTAKDSERTWKRSTTVRIRTQHLGTAGNGNSAAGAGDSRGNSNRGSVGGGGGSTAHTSWSQSEVQVERVEWGHLAPEIVNCLPHQFASDWWSLGVAIYEMLRYDNNSRSFFFYLYDSRSLFFDLYDRSLLLHADTVIKACVGVIRGGAGVVWGVGKIDLLFDNFACLSGYPPFYHDEDPRGGQSKIVKGDFDLPLHVQGYSANVIHRLLIVNPKDRLGGGKDNAFGALAVKKHPFFRPTDWSGLISWTPKVASLAIHSNYAGTRGKRGNGSEGQDASDTLTSSSGRQLIDGSANRGTNAHLLSWPTGAVPSGWGNEVVGVQAAVNSMKREEEEALGHAMTQAVREMFDAY
jgi:serine/threonine protein kinase